MASVALGRIAPRTPAAVAPRWNIRAYLGGAAFLWFLLWAGINTGPWNLQVKYIASGWEGAFNGVRAGFPLAMLIAWLLNFAIGTRRRRRMPAVPELLWMWYGLVCLIASIQAVGEGPWFFWGYWGLAYFGTFAAVDLYMQAGAPFARASELNRLSWVLCTLVLLTLLLVARGELLAETRMGISGYGVLGRMPTVAGMAMVRATGISRMAAMPAIVAFVGMWESGGIRRVLWAAVFAASFYLVWVMQSRGSTISLSATMVFIMILLGGRARRLGWLLGFLVLLVYLAGYIPDENIHRYYLFAMRGEQGQRLESMSGRDHIYREAWEKIDESPVIGFGPQADRQFAEIGNAQNGLLYALLCGGFVGAAGYLGGLLVSWIMLIKVLVWRKHLAEDSRKMVLIVTGIMAFLTMRSIPENCAALYSIDLLLQLPAIVYIGETYRALNRAKSPRRNSRRGPIRASTLHQ